MNTQSRLKELLSYSTTLGIFIWKSKHNRMKAGDIAGTVNCDGYIVISVDRERYMAHVLAWVYVYGVFPKGQVDHKDRIKTHNFIKNLRDVTNAVNQQNNIKPMLHNKNGFRGASFHKSSGKYQGYICTNGERIYLGLFDTAEEASTAYKKAKKHYHPEYIA